MEIYTEKTIYRLLNVKMETSEWWVNDLRHRENNKPAVEWGDGRKSWYVNGLSHRTNGPAFENASGHKSWHLEGVEYSEEEYNKKVKDYV